MAYSSENSRKLYAERDNNRQGNIGRQGVNRDGQSSNVGGLGERNLHRMLIDERKNINLTGVNDVRSFDEKLVIMDTALGMLTIKVDGLHVNRLNLEKGEVIIDGKVDGIEYADQREAPSPGGIIGRLFG